VIYLDTSELFLIIGLLNPTVSIKDCVVQHNFNVPKLLSKLPSSSVILQLLLPQ
jgi:hypothetical protein